MSEQAHCTEHDAYVASCRWCRIRRRLQLHDEYMERTREETVEVPE